MRVILPVGGIAVAAILYTWLWFANAELMEGRLTKWVDEQRASGTEIDYEAVSFSGFPFALQMRVTKPEVTVTAGADVWTYAADRVVFSTLPFKLTHTIMEIDGRQSFQILRHLDDAADTAGDAGQVIRVHRIAGEAESMRASVYWDRAMVERIDLEILAFAGVQASEELPVNGTGTLTGTAQPVSGDPAPQNRTIRLASGTIHLHRRADEAQDPLLAADLDMRLGGIHWDGAELPGLGQDVSAVRADATLTGLSAQGLALLDAPPAELVERWRENGGRLDIRKLDVDWGPVRLGLRGNLGLDDDTRVLGKLDLSITGHEKVLEALETTGAINANMANASRMVFDFIGSLSHADGNGITVPVNLSDGKVLLGPAKIGELDPVVKNDPVRPGN